MSSAYKATVRLDEETEELTLTLDFGEGRVRELQRQRNEPLQRALYRVQVAASQYPDFSPKKEASEPDAKGKKKGKKDKKDELPHAELRDGRDVIDLSTPNETAWCESNTLYVAHKPFPIVVNPPTVSSVSLSTTLPMPGYPVCAWASVRFGRDSATGFRWLLRRNATKDNPLEERLLGDGPEYVPTREELCGELWVEVTASDGFREGGSTRVAVGRVEEGPEEVAGTGRHSLTRERAAAPVMRVMTYNILADQYASTDYAKDVLFSYCTPHALEASYRRQLLLREILGFNLDVAALQECDEKAFTIFSEVLGRHGMRGHFVKKAGSVSEGCALFWMDDRFRLVDTRELAMKDLAEGNKSDGWASWKEYPAVRDLVAKNGALKRVLSKVTTVLQAALLVPRDTSSGDRPLVVANTHLFFYPTASHVRTLHAFVMADQIRKFAAESLQSGLVKERPAVVWCGDFNADLNDGLPGIAEMLQYGSVSPRFWDWKDVPTFSWDREEEAGHGDAVAHEGGAGAAGGRQEARERRVGEPEGCWLPEELNEDRGVALKAPLRLFAAGGMEAPWTNYVRGYRGLLDYVWVDRSMLREVREIPLPSEAEVAAETAIPSSRFPSDHVSVVFELEWLPKGDTVPLTDDMVPVGVCAMGQGELIGVQTGRGLTVLCDPNSEEGVQKMRALVASNDAFSRSARPIVVTSGVPSLCDAASSLRGLFAGAMGPGREALEVEAWVVSEGSLSRFMDAFGGPAVGIVDGLTPESGARTWDGGDLRVVFGGEEGRGNDCSDGSGGCVVLRMEVAEKAFAVREDGPLCGTVREFLVGAGWAERVQD